MAGIIFCHLVLTTPIIFKTLDEDSASRFLRAIFPALLRVDFSAFFTSDPDTLFSGFPTKLVDWF